MLAFDQGTIWQALEERRAMTTNPRHRRLLEVVMEHGKAEAARSLDRLMATLVPDPQYHFWVQGRDVGPKGYDGVRAYYEAFVNSGGAVFESPKERIVVDDFSVAHEGEIRNLLPGEVAKARGYSVPDESGHYLVRFRNVVFWSFDDNGLALGEDSYSMMHPDDWQRVEDADLPSVYVEYLASLAPVRQPG